MIEKVDFLGLSISIFDKNELINYIVETILLKENRIFYGYSLGTLAYLKRHPDIYTYGEKSDLFVTDGRFLFLLAKYSGIKLKYEISLPNLVNLTLKIANRNHWSVFILGATEENNSLAQKRIKKIYSGIYKVNGHNGYFKQGNIHSLVNTINRFKYQIILIGISSPDKEILAVLLREQTNANIIIPCGGMIDVLAGKTKLAPKWIKKIGFASLFRLVQEPRRLIKRYLFLYSYLFFSFFPKYLYFVIIKGNKNYSFVK